MVARNLRGGGRRIHRVQKFSWAVKYFVWHYNDIYISHYTLVQTHRRCNIIYFIKVNPKVNHGFWWLWYVNAIHPWLKKKNKYHSVDNGYACMWGISVPSCQFCYKPKTALRKKFPKKKKLTLRIDIFGKTFVSLIYVYILHTCAFVGLWCKMCF